MTTSAQDIRNQFMSKYNVSDDIILKGTIRTGDTPGPTYISADPSHNSVVKPTYVTIQTIDEFKHYGGNSDELYTNNLLEDHHEDIPEWNSAQTALSYSELSAQEKVAVCKAYQTYLYGNSQKVQSYKDVLQKHFFPAQLAICAAQDVVVDPNNPLILAGDGDHPVTFSFNTVTIKPGGQIINQGNTTLLVDTFIQEESTGLSDAPPTNSFVSIGADGQNGAPGGNGGNGAAGAQGSASSSGKHSCNTAAGNGYTGGSGNPGTPGGAGSRGSDSQVVRATFTVVEGPVTLGSFGGNGGNGGNGGHGGQGGQGGAGGSGSDHCSQGKQGNGGTGGAGGDGGPGGDSGNGQNVYCTYQTLGPNGSISLGPPQKGQGGQGGAAGNGGNGGPGSIIGSGGKAGAPGTNGKNGTAGTVYINNLPQA